MRRVVLPLLVAGGVAAALRHVLRGSLSDVDPLDGRPPVFPDGATRVVTTDDGAEINTRRTGFGPTVVLVHGLTSNMDDFGPVAEALVARGFEVIGIEQRGHGASTVGRDGFGVERQAADLAQALVALDVRDAVVAGHSMGGMAAMGLAIHDPEVVRDRIVGLCLIATAADLTGPRARVQARFADLAPLRAVARRPDRFPGLLAHLVLGPQRSAALVGACVASFHRCPESTRIGATQGLEGMNLVDRLGAIRCPTLVVGAAHDNLTPVEASEVIAERIPGARLEILPDVGHMVIWEAVDHLADLIAGFAGEVQPAEAGQGRGDQRRR